jgi:hypothetical protein
MGRDPSLPVTDNYQKQFYLTIREARDVFAAVPEVPVSDFLQAILKLFLPLLALTQRDSI